VQELVQALGLDLGRQIEGRDEEHDRGAPVRLRAREFAAIRGAVAELQR
jgi:hypothetical protein